MNQVEFLKNQLQDEGFLKNLELDEQEAVGIMLSRYISEDWWHLSSKDIAKMTKSRPEMWEKLLGTFAIRQFVDRRAKQFTAESHRKGIVSLAMEAQQGNVQAIKELKELSGIMNQQESKTVVILHRVSRPEEV
jgi:hypothetical protein